MDTEAKACVRLHVDDDDEKQPKNNVSVYFSHFPGMNKILEKVPIDKQL